MYAVNVRGTSALLAACAAAGVRRVVVTSTIGTVGRPVVDPRKGIEPRTLPDERTPFNLWHGASHYVRSKYLGELVARAWAEAGLDVVIVKPTAPVGPGDARPTATGARILAALAGEVTPYPPGGINHAPVRDIAVGHLLAAERAEQGQTYILGHRDGNLDHAAFLRLVAEAAGMRPPPGGDLRLKPPKEPAPSLRSGQALSLSKGVPTGRSKFPVGGMPASLTADPSRAIRELGMPQSDLRGAFVEAVAWYRANVFPG
jgi:dihydroflavonol-4-reductase